MNQLRTQPRVVTVIDGPADGRRIVVDGPAPKLAFPVAPPIPTSLPPEGAGTEFVRFETVTYDIVELRRDVFVAVPQEWYSEGHTPLFDRICAHLAAGYVGRPD